MKENHSEFENMDGESEDSDGRAEDNPTEAREKIEREKEDAEINVAEQFINKTKRLDAILRERPVFFIKGREYRINSTEEYWVGKGQAAINEAKRILALAREEGDYRLEQAAALLVEKLEHVGDYRHGIAELVSDHPELYKVLAILVPGLDKELSAARDDFESW
jgi:hypothetical protein